jgi:hypothetical protein
MTSIDARKAGFAGVIVAVVVALDQLTKQVVQIRM